MRAAAALLSTTVLLAAAPSSAALRVDSVKDIQVGPAGEFILTTTRGVELSRDGGRSWTRICSRVLGGRSLEEAGYHVHGGPDNDIIPVGVVPLAGTSSSLTRLRRARRRSA